MQEEEVVLIVLTLIIFAGVAVLWMAMTNRRLVREMEHRERLAMIQQGLMPAPETDPRGFEAHVEALRPDGSKQERWRTAGVMTIGLGMALMIMLTLTAGEAATGFGVGGAFVVLGAAFLFNAGQIGPKSSTPGIYLPRRAQAVPPPEPPRSVPP